MGPILNNFPVIKFLFHKVKNNLVKVIIVFLFLCGLFILQFWFEHQVDSSVSRWDTINNSLIIITGEYPDAMKSLGGRVVQLVLLCFGTLFLSAIIGSLSSFFVTEAAKSRPPNKKFKNHFIICNWNSKALKIISQLEKGEAENRLNFSSKLNFKTTSGPTILIISSSIIETQDDIIEQNPNCKLYFIHDDPSHHKVLAQYGADKVKSIILLADKKSQDPDGKNALIALAVKHLETKSSDKAKDIRVIAELSNAKYYDHLINAGADEVIGRNYSAGIIAQAAIFPGMSIVFDKLLTYSDETNEFYFINGSRETENQKSNYPAEWKGKDFDSLLNIISKYYSTPDSQTAVKCQCPKASSNPLLLIGIKRGTTDNNGKEIFLNPKPGEFNCLMEGDSLIIMAYDVITEIK